MIALVRFIVAFVKKEQVVLHRYEKTHPHFVWYVLIDAVLSVGLVLGGFQVSRAISDPNRSHIENEDAGAIPLTADGLFRHFQGEKRVAYWLGPKAGFSYTPIGVESDVVTITYFPGGTSPLSKINEPKLTVETYVTEAVYESHGQELVQADRIWTTNARGDEVRYDTSSMNFAIVKLKGIRQIVRIHYPLARSSASILEDSMALNRVW